MERGSLRRQPLISVSPNEVPPSPRPFVLRTRRPSESRVQTATLAGKPFPDALRTSRSRSIFQRIPSSISMLSLRPMLPECLKDRSRSTGEVIVSPEPQTNRHFQNRQSWSILPNATSGQQGRVSVQFGQASRAIGSGKLRLEFRPSIALAPDDEAVRFIKSNRSTTFEVTEGVTIPVQDATFQTGTTAGTIVFTAEVGGWTATSSVEIAPQNRPLRSSEAPSRTDRCWKSKLPDTTTHAAQVS